MLAWIGWPDPDRAARSKWFQRGIGERQSLDASAAADQWRRAAGNRADKMVELAAVRFGAMALRDTAIIGGPDRCHSLDPPPVFEQCTDAKTYFRQPVRRACYPEVKTA
jgi:hypothetical protein